MAPRAVPVDVEQLLAQSGWARGLAQRLVRDPELAEDVLQETWVAALERPPSEGSLRAWLGVVVRNVSLRLRRREAARGEVERRVARREAVAGGQESVERMQLQRALAEAILALDEPYRSAVIQRHLDGLSASEIGTRQGCSAETARQRVARGLAALRVELDRRTVGGRAAWCAALIGSWRIAPAPAWTAAAAPAAVWIGGVWMGTKALVAAAGLVLAVGAWVWIQHDSAPSEASAASPADVQAALQSPGSASDLRPADAAPSAASITAPDSARERVDTPNLQQTALHGRVIDERGRGLAGAKVALLPFNPFPLPKSAAALAETQSDPQGSFAIELDRAQLDEVEAAPFPCTVSAELSGYVPARIAFRSGSELELVLVERPFVRGRLLDPSGVPARPPGRVSLTVLDAAGGEHASGADIDELGQFEARELVPGKLTNAEGRARGFGTVRVEPGIDLAPGAQRELDLTLSSGSIVRGIVVDARSKAPIPFAEVWSQSWSYQPDSIEPSSVADAEGRFELRGVNLQVLETHGAPTGLRWLFISARAPGYAGKPFEGMLVQPSSDGACSVTVEIPRAAATLSGLVRWPDGSPAAGLLVTALDSQSNLLWKVTDGDGRFELADLPEGTLAVHARTRPEDDRARPGVARADVEVRPGETSEVELTLDARCGIIAGRLLDASGAPLAGIPIEAGEHFQAVHMTIGIGSHSTTTDAEGRYRLPGLLASRYQVQPVGLDLRGKLARPDSVTIELEPGEERTDADFEIVAAIEVSGWIDPGTLPLGELEVQAVKASDGSHGNQTSPGTDGTFVLGGLYPEAHNLLLLHNGSEVARVPIGAAGASGVRLVAPR